MTTPALPTIDWKRIRAEASFYGVITGVAFATLVAASFVLQVLARRFIALDQDGLILSYLIINPVTGPLTGALLLAGATGALRFIVRSINSPVSDIKAELADARKDRANLWHSQHNIASAVNNALETSNRAVETADRVLDRVEKHERSTVAHTPRRRAKTA